MTLTALEIERLLRVGAELGLASLELPGIKAAYGVAPKKAAAPVTLANLPEDEKQLLVEEASALGQWYAAPFEDSTPEE